MAKPKMRDVDEGTPKQGYLTKSRAQLDLERRTEEGYVSDSALNTPVVNPNPFGKDEYVGTDAIYQNSSTDANKPLVAEEGAEKKVVDAYREEHKVDSEKKADDPGLGGEAEAVPVGTAATTYRTILPGQEGYDLKKAEEQNGPPLRVYNDEELPESADESEEEDEGDGDGDSNNQPPSPPNPS